MGKTLFCFAAVVMLFAVSVANRLYGQDNVQPPVSLSRMLDVTPDSSNIASEDNRSCLFQEKIPGHEVGEGKPAQEKGHLRSWEVEEVTVYGKKPLKEEQLIGSAKQPRWTARRRFPTTRVYTIPEGTFEFEWWVKSNVSHGGDTETSYYYELEMGLPYRFQLDLYTVVKDEGGVSPLALDAQQIELRWAMAEWGSIWGNPTWYAEYIQRNNESDKFEAKLLLGDELTSRWHWGINLVYEWTMQPSYKREEEIGMAGGIAYTVVDSILSLGLEAKWGTESAAQKDPATGKYDKEWITTLKVGPSFQFRPTPAANIQFAPLFGVTNESEKSQIWFVVGWEF